MKPQGLKTPFEIRLELLQLAFDILTNRAVTEANQQAETDNKAPVVIAPTTEQVIAEAQKLNGFVSTAATPTETSTPS